MTGSVSSETQPPSAKAKSTGGKSGTDSEQTKETQQKNDSPSNRTKDFNDKASKHLLPPLAAESRQTPSSSAQAAAASPQASGKPTFTRVSSIPAKNMDEGTNTLGRHGRAQSFLTLCSIDDDEHGFEDSGSRSELGGPVSAHRRRGEPRGYGTLERATSYSSLTMRPLFRSANSVRPRPAPPCTTTHLDYCRHPVNSPANSRLIRRGTPRANNPHPVGLYFQSPYNRDGKVSQSNIGVMLFMCGDRSTCTFKSAI